MPREGASGPSGSYRRTQHEAPPSSSGASARPVHPGRPLPPRQIALRATGVRQVGIAIDAGEELFAFGRRVAAGLGGRAALLDVDRLAMRPVALHIPEPDPAGRQIMRYGAAIVIEPASLLVSGQMSIGGTAMAPVLHAHGQVTTADGRRLGGHLSDGGCVAAARAVVACTVLDGIGLMPGFDPETGFALLEPVRSGPAAVGAVGAVAVDPVVPPVEQGWLLRLKPDEDLVGSLDALARTQGLVRPRIVGGVGSLMDATLHDASGRTLRVPGPGVEIVTLRSVGPALHMVVADLEGRIHEGTPVPGGNPICVTIELFLTFAPGDR